jgi:hypothetical protein
MMMRWLLKERTLTAALLGPVLAATLLAAPARAAVRLNEILADPDSDWDGDGAVDFRGDEWVEIYNGGGDTVDLGLYWITDTENFTWRFHFSGTLGPGEARVVMGSEAVAWESANGYPSAGLSLNNSGDTVRMYRIVGPDTTLVDAHTYGSHVAVDDRATGRYPSGYGLWFLFDGLNPYSGSQEPRGSGCDPSPGVPNDCPTATRHESWGGIKAIFGGSR